MLQRTLFRTSSVYQYSLIACFSTTTGPAPSLSTSTLPIDAKKPVRVRFAPSPTGSMHLGGLRTALYNYLLAKQHNGQFIVRIEDTDQARFVPGATEDLLNTLEWAGLEYDEGPGKEREEYGSYVQSERAGIYQEHALKLVEKGHAYPCWCPKDTLIAGHFLLRVYVCMCLCMYISLSGSSMLFNSILIFYLSLQVCLVTVELSGMMLTPPPHNILRESQLLNKTQLSRHFPQNIRFPLFPKIIVINLFLM